MIINLSNINFDGNGGGGGGSYVLPVATADRLGGVKVGSGLSIDSGGTLSSEGGGNYVIVDALSAVTDPYDGLLVYVEGKTEDIVFTGWTIDASNIDENYAFTMYPNGENSIGVYHNSEGFHWGWDNNANGELIKSGDWYYTINEEKTEFSCFFNNPDAFITLEEGALSASTSTTITVSTEGKEYRYNGTDWERMNNIRICYLNAMTQEELADLYGEIRAYTESTFPAGRYHFYSYNSNNDEYIGKYELYVARFDGEYVDFSGHMQSRYDTKILMRGYRLDYEGNLSEILNTNVAVIEPTPSYIEPGYDSAESYTGVSHDGWATIWETSKSDGFSAFSNKSVNIKLFEGDVIPFKFHLVKASGTSEDESTMVLYFSGMQADYDTNTITVRKFSLYKDVNSDTYVPSALATSTYSANV